MKNKLVIFDFFGVICSEIAPYVFANHFDAQTAIKKKNAHFLQADLGTITMDKLYDEIAADIGISREALIEEWNSYIIIDQKVVEFIKSLRSSYDVALISNAPLGFVEELLQRFDLAPLFDKIIVSSAVKISKPNPEIYKLCVSSLGKNYDKIYMVDDNPENLKPLDKLGITPVLFATADDLNKIFD